jgi:hypothetical protein
MLGGIGAAHTERMKRYRQLGSLMSVIDEDHPGRVFLGRTASVAPSTTCAASTSSRPSTT